MASAWQQAAPSDPAPPPPASTDASTDAEEAAAPSVDAEQGSTSEGDRGASGAGGEDGDDEIVAADCTECDLDDETSLCYQMQHSKYGVPARIVRSGVRTYPSVFSGKEAVTWLAGRLLVPRDQAVQRGRALQHDGLFSSVEKDVEFSDSSALFRFAKHDPSKRFTAANVSDGALHLEAYGFLGCPFCHRAVEAGNALAAEIKDESVFTFHGEEMENRAAFNAFLTTKRKNVPTAAFHSSSPIVFARYEGVEQYIGGLDNMLHFLGNLKRFANTRDHPIKSAAGLHGDDLAHHSTDIAEV